MSESSTTFDRSEPNPDEIVAVGCAIATAVRPEGGLTDVQVSVLQAVTHALTGVDLDYQNLPELGPAELAQMLEQRDQGYRRRIVHHMLLGELVLRPLPDEVAVRVGTYAEALGVDDDFVRVARRYAQGAFGVAWVDLRRSGFTDRWDEARLGSLHASSQFEDPFDQSVVDPELEARWQAFGELAPGTLGREIWEMYSAPRVRAARQPARRIRVHRAARLRTRPRRLRHHPRRRARDVRARGPRRSRSQRLRVARHHGRPLRDRLRA